MKKFVIMLCWPILSQAQIAFTTNEDALGFGTAYAINGADIAVGCATVAASSNPQPGKVYYFSKASGTVEQQQIIDSPSGSITDRFGDGLALHGDYMAVGASGGTGIGKLYIFKRNEGVYELFQTVSAPDEMAGDHFGRPYFQGDALFVTAVADEPDGAPEDADSGSVYVFDINGDDWEFTQKLEIGGTSGFGTEFRVDGDLMVIGALTTDDSKALYTYNRLGETWTYKGITTLFAEEQDGMLNYYHGFDLADGQLYVLKDLPFSGNGEYTAIVTMNSNNGIWEETSSFSTDTGDEYYRRIEIEGDRMFVSDISQYILAMSRQWPIHYFKRTDGVWNYQTAFYSTAAGSGDDDGFGRVTTTGPGGLLSNREFSMFPPHNGKAYLIDFGTLSAAEFTRDHVTVFPNPARTTLNFRMDQEQQPVAVELIDMEGSVLQRSLAGNGSVNVSNLSSGLYLIRFHFENQPPRTSRFINN